MASEFATGQSLGRRLVSPKGAMTTGVALVIGAVAAAAAQYAVEHTDFFNKYWYAPALGVAFVGHVAKAARNPWIAISGASMVGAAGAMGYYSYKLNKASQASSGTQTAGVQSDAGSPMTNFMQALKSLPETTGVQTLNVASMRRTNPISVMRPAA